jgi:hypothetical protein
MSSILARLVLASIGVSASLAAGNMPVWLPWQHLAGVFDLAGPRSDGRLVAAGGSRLYLVSPDGLITPFGGGPGGYQGPVGGAEAYIDVSPGLRVAGSGCAFARDDIFAIRPSTPLGITRVDAAGHRWNFVDITGVDTLNGIVFDRVGRFDHRLLVTGPHNGHTTVIAIDCNGAIVTITDSAAPVEGGLAVAPSTFGAHGGELIAPDENSGMVWTINASGRSELLVASGIAHGGDIGVESAGFIPSGFTGGGGFVFVADRTTPNNPHPGTDTILRMSSADLASAARVRDGDLLIAAEGGAVTIDVRCTTVCRSSTVVANQTSAHIEGHLVVVAHRATSTPASLPAVSDLGSQRAQQLVRIVTGVIIAAVFLLLVTLAIRRLRRR